MIKTLTLHNFKAFEDQDFEFRPITLIIGKNNSGKSSILSALRLLVQTLESPDTDVPLLLNGIMGDLGTYKDIVYGNHRSRKLSIGITISGANHRQDDSSLYLTYGFRTQRRELILESSELKNNHNILIKTKYSKDTERQIVEILLGSIIQPEHKSSFSKFLQMRNFLPRISTRLIEKEEVWEKYFTQKEIRSLYSISKGEFEILRNLIKIEYIGAMRIPPARIYTYTGERRKRIGATGENAVNILAMNDARGDKDSEQIIELVSQWLKKAEIASKFVVSPASDRFYEIRIQHPKTLEIENLADVGKGNSQILPVLVGGYNLNSGSIFLVEEPEIHLHPKAQAELGSFFLDLYHRGVQSIVETHCDYLILRLQQYVASGEIPPDHIQFIYVDADENGKTIKTLELDEDGFFNEELPGGFFPEQLEEAKKLSYIRTRKIFSE